MTALIQDDFRIQSARQFIQSVDGSESYYLVLGRTRPWADESNPEVPLDNIEYVNQSWMDFLAARKIESSNTGLSIVRNNWTANTVYDKYRHDISPTNPTAVSGATSLFESTFYVINSELNVYKCIDNANGSPSTKEPQGTSTLIQELSDGYHWKFLYGLTSLEALQFITPDYILAKTVAADDGTGSYQVQQNAVDGAINHISVENSGSGYYDATAITVTVEGDGTGLDAVVTASDLDGSGNINSVTINDPGSGYHYATATISSTETNASGAVIKPIISPKGGHGSDPIRELGSFNLMINLRIEDNATNFFVDNDFRTIGILLNPLNQSGSVSTALNARLSKTLTLSSISGSIVGNDTIQGDTSNAEGHLVQNRSPEFDYVKAIENKSPEFQVGESITASSGGTATIDAIADSDFQYFTGHVMYLENRRPIVRVADQQEDIKLIIEW